MIKSAVAYSVALGLLAIDAARAQHTDCTTQSDATATLRETVRDRSTRVPLPGAVVSVSWQGRARPVRATTDSLGHALLCVPSGQVLTIQASYRGVQSGSQSTILGRDYNERTSMVDVPGSLLRGTVVDNATSAPLHNVAVRLNNTPLTVLTTPDGRFLFERVPVGDYQLHVEHISYGTIRTPISISGEDLNAEIRMTPVAIPLVPVVVTAFSRRLERIGFYEREKRGVGIFLGRKDIDAMNVQRASDLLRRVPSSRIIPQTARRNVPPNVLLGRGNCRYRFIVDGARTLPDFEMDFIEPYAIEGVEVYNGPSEVPDRFRAFTTPEGGTPLCGVVVIWTRDGR